MIYFNNTNDSGNRPGTERGLEKAKLYSKNDFTAILAELQGLLLKNILRHLSRS